MADATFNNPNAYGAFNPSTEIFDVAQLYSIDVNSPEFKELLVRLYLSVNRSNLILNVKDTGYYDTREFVNGQVFFPNPSLSSTTSTMPTFRQVYRKVINFGVLPDAAINPLKTVAHGITVTQATTFTRIYGAASDTAGLTYIPLPYASPVLANNIELSVDATNISITTGSNRTNYTITFIIVEYLQN